MKVRMLRNPKASIGCSLKEGQAGDVDDSLGSELVKIGVAISLDEPQAIKAVPPKPAIAEPAKEESPIARQPSASFSDDDLFGDAKADESKPEAKEHAGKKPPKPGKLDK